MKLIVDIDDNDYELLNKTGITIDWNTAFHGKEKDREMTFAIFNLAKALKNGTPVYEHERPQGDLISREALKKAIKEFEDVRGYSILLYIIDNAPTVHTENCEGCPYCPNSDSGIPIGVE